MTILLFALTCSFFSVQPPSVAGVWVAEHKGTVFVRLELQMTGGRLTGQMATGTMQMDDKGGIKAVTPLTAAITPMTELTATESGVLFVYNQNDSRDRYRMTVLGDDRAQLEMVGDEDQLRQLKELGIPTLKPIALRKLR